MIRIQSLFLFVATAFLIGGCEKESSSCEQFNLAVCEDCDVGIRQQDTTCACLEDGEVDNWRDYFESKDESEAWCDTIKINNKEEHLSEDNLDQCAGALDLMDEYDDDACGYFGYDPASSNDGDDEGESETSYACLLLEDCLGESFSESYTESECLELLDYYSEMGYC